MESVKELKRLEKWIIGLGLLWFTITAWYSNGFFHNDEHYQIVEFAEYISGDVPVNDLAWEFGSKIRPSLQPYIAWAIFQSCDVIGISDHYHQAFVLRLLTALLTVLVFSLLYLRLRSKLNPEWQIPFLVALFFLWFLPFVHVRFSSETWSGLLFLFGFCFLMKENISSRDFIYSGILFGLAFLFRFQIAFGLMAIFFWLVFISKRNWKELSLMVFSAALMMALGILLDSHFYGEFTVSPWNYLKVNLIDGVAASFGESPWHGYFYRVFRFSFFPIGIALLLSFLFLIYKRPKDPIVWLALFFFIGHSLIGHKETRFLFPIAWTSPYLIIVAVQELYKTISIRGKKVIRYIGVALIIVNVFALFTASLTPAGQGRAAFCDILQEAVKQSPHQRITVAISNYHPTIPWGLPAHFYDVEGAAFIAYSDFEASQVEAPIYLAILRDELNKPKIQQFISDHQLKKSAQSLPPFFEPFILIYGFPEKDIIELYRSDLPE